MGLNVRKQLPENGKDAISKLIDKRNEIKIARKKTEMDIDTVNFKIGEAIRLYVREQHIGQAFGVTVNITEKISTVSLDLGDGFSLTTNIPGNAILLQDKCRTTINDSINKLLELQKKLKYEPKVQIAKIKSNDGIFVPRVTVNFNTRTKYF